MDIISDHTPVVLAEAQDYAPWAPELSKPGLPSKPEVAGLHKSAFAIPESREYPLHTKTAAFFGTLHYRGRGGSDPAVLSRFKAAAVAFDIEEDVARYDGFFQLKAATVKSASEEPPMEKFALELSRDGETMNIYPCRFQSDVVASVRQAVSDYKTGNLPLVLFAKAARVFVKEAQRFSMGLPTSVLYTGGDRLATPAMARAAVPVAADETSRAAYASLIKAACEVDITPDQKDQVAFAWAELDSAIGVKRASTPYELLWGGIERAVVAKVASTMVLVETDKNPVLLPLEVFNKIASEETRLRQHFGGAEADWIIDLTKKAAEPDALRLAIAAAPVARRLLLLDGALFCG